MFVVVKSYRLSERLQLVALLAIAIILDLTYLGDILDTYIGNLCGLLNRSIPDINCCCKPQEVERIPTSTNFGSYIMSIKRT